MKTLFSSIPGAIFRLSDPRSAFKSSFSPCFNNAKYSSLSSSLLCLPFSLLRICRSIRLSTSLTGKRRTGAKNSLCPMQISDVARHQLDAVFIGQYRVGPTVLLELFQICSCCLIVVRLGLFWSAVKSRMSSNRGI